MLRIAFVNSSSLKIALLRPVARIARTASSTKNVKVVVITGASSGIGKELSLQYAKQGSRLVLSARRMDKLREVKSLCDAAGAAATHIVECDVSKNQDCKELVSSSIKEFGAIDTMILNAGIGQVQCCIVADILEALFLIDVFPDTNIVFLP
jgi:short-subunit dehydrogenase